MWCCINLLLVKQIFLLACSHHIATHFPLAMQRFAFLHFAGVGHPLHGLNAAFAFDVAARAPRTGFFAI
jgi:hypothetical protein